MKNASTIQNSYPAPVLGRATSYLKRAGVFFADFRVFTIKQSTTINQQLNSKDEEIARLKWELLQKNELVNTLTFHQSHTIRRPLANILGIIELINSEKNEAGEAAIRELISLLKISADDLDKAIKHNLAAGTL